MNDQLYVVRARVDRGIVRLDLEPSSFDEALAHWTRLVSLVFPAQRGRKPRTTVLLASEIYRGAHSAHEVKVTWFDVRSLAEPAVRALPVVKLRVLRAGPGSKDDGAAFRRAGEERGYHSHEGGWIYRGRPGHAGQPGSPGRVDNPACRLTSWQGWSSWSHSQPNLPVVKLAFRYHLTEEI